MLALSFVGSAAFLVHVGDWGWRHGALVLAVGIAAVLAILDWIRAPTGVLCWDAKQWTWDTGTEQGPCTVQMAWDLQFAVVLRLKSHHGPQGYQWLEARTAPARWQALRRALVSSARHPPASAQLGTLPESRGAV